VTVAQDGASYVVTLSGTGVFAGLAAESFVLSATAESGVYGVANAVVDGFSLTADSVDIYVYPWVSSLTDGLGDLSDNAVFLTVHRGTDDPRLKGRPVQADPPLTDGATRLSLPP
jgi:hypothetical protein